VTEPGASIPEDDFFTAVSEQIIGWPRFTPEEVAGTAGIDYEETERLWSELGFPPVAPTEVFFTDADVEVLRTLRELRSTGLVAPETTITMARILGQTLSRVATAQAQTMAEVAGEGPGTPEEEADLAGYLDTVLASFDRFLGYVWRRHLVAALRRQRDSRPTEVVGFADIVGYTRLTAGEAIDTLPGLVARFQEIASQHLTEAGGRVLKVIGDAVMFVAPDPLSAAGAAVAVSSTTAEDPGFPDVRIGIAMGPVVEVEGDIYGETVNRASRLVELAHPGTVVVDDAMGNALLDSDLRVRPMKPRRLKGLGMVPTWVVRPPRTRRPVGATGPG